MRLASESRGERGASMASGRAQLIPAAQRVRRTVTGASTKEGSSPAYQVAPQAGSWSGCRACALRARTFTYAAASNPIPQMGLRGRPTR